MDKPKPKSVVSDIIDEIISLTKPKSKQDIQDELARDKINYLIWTIGVAVKDLQEEIDKLAYFVCIMFLLLLDFLHFSFKFGIFNE